jgi:hypothetical protein
MLKNIIIISIKALNIILYFNDRFSRFPSMLLCIAKHEVWYQDFVF